MWQQLRFGTAAIISTVALGKPSILQAKTNPKLGRASKWEEFGSQERKKEGFNSFRRIWGEPSKSLLGHCHKKNCDSQKKPTGNLNGSIRDSVLICGRHKTPRPPPKQQGKNVHQGSIASHHPRLDRWGTSAGDWRTLGAGTPVWPSGCSGGWAWAWCEASAATRAASS